MKKEEFLARSAIDQDKTPSVEENFKTPQIFIEQMFQLYKKGLVDDKMMEDQVALMIFGVRFGILCLRNKTKNKIVVFQGNETSALTSSHIVLMLAMHPDIQEKVVKELEEIYDDENQQTDSEKLTKLSYLEMVMKETRKLTTPLLVQSFVK